MKPNNKLIQETLSTTWSLSDAFKQRYLTGYYLLHWKKDYLLAKLAKDGTVTRNGIEYVAEIMHKNDVQCNNFKLSFRATRDSSCKNVVLIQGIY